MSLGLNNENTTIFLHTSFWKFSNMKKIWKNFGKHLYIHCLLLFNCSVVSDSVNPWTAARQASLSFTISQSLLKLMSIGSAINIWLSLLQHIAEYILLFETFQNKFPTSVHSPQIMCTIKPEILNQKDWCWSWSSYTLAIWCEDLTHWKGPWFLERLREREGDNRGWDAGMALLTQWTWVWANSRSCWWTGRPSVLQSMGSQRVGQGWATELNQKSSITILPTQGKRNFQFPSTWRGLVATTSLNKKVICHPWR